MSTHKVNHRVLERRTKFTIPSKSSNTGVVYIPADIDKENRIELMIEASERPPAGVRQSRPNSAHNYRIGGLRTNGWFRIHNY